MRLAESTIKTLAEIITGDSGHSVYRSGQKLVDFFNELGWTDTYGNNFPSRWVYAEEKIKEVNGESLIEKIILKAVDPRDFIDFPNNERDAVERLNQYLEYEGFRLVKADRYYSIEPVEPENRIFSNNIKNIIFASNGPKPEIVLSDAIDNNIRIVSHERSCLAYDRPISPIYGLTLKHLQDWYYSNHSDILLSTRLKQSLDSEAELIVFTSYYELKELYGSNFPALIPQVYLHYDPRTISELKGKKRLVRQRMDFLLLLPNSTRIIIEVDGKQHYSNPDNTSNTIKYSEMMKADRDLQLSGYRIFRFGGYELTKRGATRMIQKFFTKLLELNDIVPQQIIED